MAFVRFILEKCHPDSDLEEGFFAIASGLRDEATVDEQDRRVLKDSLEWFEKNLPEPTRFNRSKSKGYYRRATRGIAWFRDTAKDCILRMHRIKKILEKRGHQVKLLRETRVGYIVYEDDLQVVAEPFSQTRTE